MIRLITALTCFICLSCTEFLDAQVDDLNQTSELFDMEVLQLNYDSTTTYLEYFHDSHLISMIGLDTTPLVIDYYQGWNLLFEEKGMYPVNFLDDVYHSLDRINESLPDKLVSTLQESTTFSFQSYEFNRGYAGYYLTIDRSPKRSLIRLNGIYSTGTLVHELMHAWDHLYLRISQYVVSSGLHEIFISAKVNGLWNGAYTVSDNTEYFADIARYYFLDPEYLKGIDVKGYEFIETIVTDNL